MVLDEVLMKNLSSQPQEIGRNMLYLMWTSLLFWSKGMSWACPWVVVKAIVLQQIEIVKKEQN